MRTPKSLKQPIGSKRGVSEVKPIPSAVGGWNARDPISMMSLEDAILLDNWFPTPSDIMLRKGHDTNEKRTGITGQVETLMVYNNPDGSQELYAAAGTVFHDVSAAGAVGAAVVTGLTNARWQWDNFTTTGGTFLLAVNGVDAPRYWDGSSWTAITGVSTPAITGVTTTDLINISIHKNRVWFVEKGTLSAWFLPVDSIGGAASEFPLSGVAKKGGFLMATGTWTIDAGEGVDDYWVAVTSEGEIIVYKGTNPSSSATWALVGVWSIGEPIGRKCLLKWGGDLLIINKEGVLPLSQALLSSQTNPKIALTDKIDDAAREAVAIYGGNFGWQLLHYPSGSMLLLNVPTFEGSNQHQYVMNTISKRWGRFKDIEANCWALYGGEPYFGGNGFVGKFWSSFDDDGSDIQAQLKQAFSDYGYPGIKDFKAVRSIFATNGSPSVLFRLNIDYDDAEPIGSLTFTPLTGALWDAVLWDVGVWGGGLSASRSWRTVGGTGIVASPRMKVAAQGIEVRHQSYDILYERGGIIG